MVWYYKKGNKDKLKKLEILFQNCLIFVHYKRPKYAILLILKFNI